MQKKEQHYVVESSSPKEKKRLPGGYPYGLAVLLKQVIGATEQRPYMVRPVAGR